MKIHLFGYKDLIESHSKILRDEAKYTMVLGKALLYVINLWPEKYVTASKVSFVMMFTTCVTMEVSLIVYLLTSIEDVNSLTKVISSAAVCLQSMTKMCIIFYHHEDLDTIIKSVWYQFWPSDTMGSTIENDIKTDSKRLLVIFSIVYIVGCMFLLLLIIAPAVTGIRKLPYSSWYPFDWSISPTYEILYVVQVYIAIYIIANTVCGYDFLYCSICANCIAQYRLLNEAIQFIGTGKESKLNEFLSEIPGVNYQSVFNEMYGDERKLLVICVRHHQKLITICYKLNKIFSYGHFVQLAASVMAMCVSCYLITIEDDASEQSFLLSYYIAHVTQLLVYCSVSNELSFWSTCLSKTAFQSLWYTDKYSDIRRCLSIVIMRSQRSININALGMFQLTYASFLTVMRFTFSLYTFLGKMAKK